jgi:hypothetical protein
LPYRAQGSQLNTVRCKKSLYGKNSQSPHQVRAGLFRTACLKLLRGCAAEVHAARRGGINHYVNVLLGYTKHRLRQGAERLNLPGLQLRDAVLQQQMYEDWLRRINHSILGVAARR